MEANAPQSAGFYNFLGWLDVNKKRVAIGVSVAIVVGLVVALILWRNAEQENEAALALSAVRVPFNPVEAPAPGTAEAFLKVAEEYPNTATAPQAVLRAAAVYFSDGNYAKAAEQFNRFLSKHGETPWVPQARYGLAACADAQGNTQDALTRYNEFIRAYPSDPAADEARLNIARLYQKANQPAQAIDVLSKMTNAGPFSAMGAEVQDRLKSIYKQHPELAPKPAAPAPATPKETPLMLRDVPRQPSTGSAPTATPGAPNASAPTAPKINLQNPQQAAPAPAK